MSRLSREIVERCFASSDSLLRINGLSIAAIAQQYETPLFIYDRGLLDRRLSSLRRALSGMDIYYSVKANPNLAILSHFVGRGCGLEIASEGELLQAIGAGCEPNRIVFAGPAKSERELELAIGKHVGEIHIESQNEAMRIASICKRRGARISVGIRINPASEAQGGAMRMGGKAAPFGVDEEAVWPLVRYLLSESCFDFCGIHMSAGTQILDYSVLIAQYRKCIQVAGEIVSVTGRPHRTVDFGGGLGIPYFEGDQELDLESFRRELMKLMDEIRHDARFNGTQFLLEPGRFLVGEAGLYIVRIMDIKHSRGKKFLIADGGMNHHLAASGNLGQTIKRNYPIVVVDKLAQIPEETVDVVGPLCTPLDTLGRAVSLPKAEIGDLIAILQSGAYGRTASPTGFLSHPTPAEVLVDEGNAYLVRDRGEGEDAMRGMHIPPFLQHPPSPMRHFLDGGRSAVKA